MYVHARPISILANGGSDVADAVSDIVDVDGYYNL